MLVIRRQQMEKLSQYMIEQFKDRMVTHLQSTFPDQTREMEERNLRDVIQAGIKKAESYKVVIEDDVQLFLECMITYGADFDINPETAWAGEILQQEDMDGSEKMDRIDEYIRSISNHST